VGTRARAKNTGHRIQNTEWPKANPNSFCVLSPVSCIPHFPAGKVLILDSPENAGSTANSLLYPFGLSLDTSQVLKGSVEGSAGRPEIQIESAHQVAGGQPVVLLNSAPIGATVRYGKGSVTAVGYGSAFVDSRMGVTGDVVPDEQLRSVYDLEFKLLRQIISPPAAP